MNEQLEKELTKSYSKVVKKDVQVKEGIEKLVGAYEKEKKSNANNLKDEFKQYRALDKDIKDAHKTSLKSIKDNNKDQLAGISVKVQETKKKHKELEEKALSKFDKEIERLTKQKDKRNADFEKLVQKEQTAFDKDNANFEKELEKIAKDGETVQLELSERYVEKEAKYKEKVEALNTKRDEKIEKMNEGSAKTIAKLEDGIQKQRAKVDKQLQDNVPFFEEKLEEINNIISKEQTDYDTQVSDIKDTLNSKLERRNKFLEKAENEKDTKAAKIQRKEIKQLQQAADKELKSIDKAHVDRKSDLEAKKLEVLKNNLEQIASIEREFVNFKEDNLMQIELNKVTLSDQITKLKLDTELKLQDELNKFNEFTEKHNIKAAKEVEKTKLAEADQRNQIAKRKIDFDKVNEENRIHLEEDLALNLKEQQIAELQKNNALGVNEVELEIALANLENEKEVKIAEFDRDVLLNDHDALIKYHEADNKKQNSVKSEFTDNQEALLKLTAKRAEEIAEYEELEILNRASLRESFLETQQKRIENDLKEVIKDSELALKQELELYEKEIDKLAKEDQKAIIDFKHSEEEKIQALVDEKKECNPKIDKARIMEIDSQLDSMKSTYRNQLKQKEDALYAKTKIYQDNIELAKERQSKAEQEVRELTDLELANIKLTLEVLNANKEEEIQAVRARYEKSISNYANFKNLITNRNQQTTEENLNYTNIRIADENKAKENASSVCESARQSSKEKLESAIQNQDSLRNSHNEELKNKAAAKESELENKLAEFKKQKDANISKEQSELSNQKQSYSNTQSDINNEFNNKESEIEKLLSDQQKKNVADVQEIDRKQVAENKHFESEKAKVKREYDTELQKGLKALNDKLALDIKALK